MGKIKFYFIKRMVAFKAAKAGICNEWYNKILEAKCMDELFDIYVSGMDFCVMNDFPSVDDIRKHAPEVANSKGVYYDGNVRLMDDSRRHIVLLGTTMAMATYRDNATVSLYARHMSQVRIEAGGTSFVCVHASDCAKVHVVASGAAKVVVFLDDDSDVKEIANEGESVIKIIDRRKK